MDIMSFFFLNFLQTSFFELAA